MAGGRTARPEVEARLAERTVSQEVVWEGRFLRIRSDQALLSNGVTAGREFVLHPGAAAMVPLDTQGRVLMERQFRYPMGQSYLEIPAGKRDAGESTLQTAQRELLEETGYRAGEWALLTSIHPAIGFSNEVIDIWLARSLQAVGQQLDDEELLELEWWSIPDLVDLVRSGGVPDVKTQIAVHWLERITSGQWPWPVFSPA